MTSIPSILVRESDQKFVDQRISKARFLSVSFDRSCCSPTSNDVISISDEASCGDLEGKCIDIEPSQDVVGRIVNDPSGEAAGSCSIDGDEIHEIENLSNVDGEGIGSLADENSSCR